MRYLPLFLTLGVLAACGHSKMASRQTSVNGVERAVFSHFMIGTMTQDQATKDVQDAQAAGFTAFALNTQSLNATFATDAFRYMFQAADAAKFKLFFSFDMSANAFQPADIPATLAQYANRSSYYTVDGKPFVSTFQGAQYSNAQWTTDFRQKLATDYNLTPFFVPDFDDAQGYPNNFINTYTVVDGAFSWEAAWPSPGDTISNVSSTVDQNVWQQAHAAGKVYMMSLSTFQFKYGSFGKWYRAGELNLPERMLEILAVQPDFVESVTWNDAGEGHYIGNLFIDAISGSPDIISAVKDFDHSGWQQLITAFIASYKKGATKAADLLPLGATPIGTLWYRTQLVNSSCEDSAFQNRAQGVDQWNFAVMLPADGYTINLYSNDQKIGTFAGNIGLNYGAAPSQQEGGGQRLEIIDNAGKVVASVNGTKPVTSGEGACNWNYEVVGIAPGTSTPAIITK